MHIPSESGTNIDIHINTNPSIRHGSNIDGNITNSTPSNLQSQNLLRLMKELTESKRKCTESMNRNCMLEKELLALQQQSFSKPNTHKRPNRDAFGSPASSKYPTNLSLRGRENDVCAVAILWVLALDPSSTIETI
mmetsp:Transcript_44542/g.53457  ORF Transcript_44542/g.53457 Transcript_44542/m.53457 type:complete len:136 (+) Transcript_44542:1443-1850(+)